MCQLKSPQTLNHPKPQAYLKRTNPDIITPVKPCIQASRRLDLDRPVAEAGGGGGGGGGGEGRGEGGGFPNWRLWIWKRLQ